MDNCGSLSSSGKVFIDGGAAKALSNGKSLLAAGITKVKGNFRKRGKCVNS